jgi:uncharacterized membrane protein YphA (DoxX/SURF4 family)
MKAPRCCEFLATAPILSAIRFIIGGLFVYAGLAKIMDPHNFLRAIVSFQIVPFALVGPMAIVLPVLEAVAGGAWIMNRWPRAAALIISALSLIFLGALGAAIMRGVSADCGCFVGLGAGATSLEMALVRDVILAGATGWWLIVDRRRENPSLPAQGKS